MPVRPLSGSDAVVEDDADVAQMLQRALESESENYSVAVASDGFRAAYLVYSFRPDLIILDIRLPGIDGVEVCKVIKEDPASSHTKIVVVSAYLDDQTTNQLKEAGVDDLFPKPVDVEKLLGKIYAYMFGGRRR